MTENLPTAVEGKCSPQVGERWTLRRAGREDVAVQVIEPVQQPVFVIPADRVPTLGEWLGNTAWAIDLDYLLEHGIPPETEETLCESPVELAFLREIRKHADLSPLLPNVSVMAGRYRIDFANQSAMVGVEIDGHAYHSDKTTFVKDRQRQRELEKAGWRLIRFAAVEITDDVAACVQQFYDWCRALQIEWLRPCPAPIDPATGRVKLGGRAHRSAAST